MRGAEGESAAEQQRRRASFQRSARPLRAASGTSEEEGEPIATNLGSAIEASAVGAAATLGFAAPPVVAPTSCASAPLAAAAATTLVEPPALKPTLSRSRSAGPSMSLGSGAGPSGEPPQQPQQRDEQTAEVHEVDEQTAERREGGMADRREGVADKLEGLLYDPIADEAELATAEELATADEQEEGRGETAEQRERALSCSLGLELLRGQGPLPPSAAPSVKTAEVVARLEGLLRVRSPTQTSKRLAKLAHITNVNDEYGGETAVLLRGLVVALIYGGLFVSMFAAP